MKAFFFLTAATLLMCAITSAVPFQAAYHPPGFGVENVVHFDIVGIDQVAAEMVTTYEIVSPVQITSLQPILTEYTFESNYWLPPGVADITGPALSQNSWRWDESSSTAIITNARYRPVISFGGVITREKSLPPLHIEFG